MIYFNIVKTFFVIIIQLLSLTLIPNSPNDLLIPLTSAIVRKLKRSLPLFCPILNTHGDPSRQHINEDATNRYYSEQPRHETKRDVTSSGYIVIASLLPVWFSRQKLRLHLCSPCFPRHISCLQNWMMNVHLLFFAHLECFNFGKITALMKHMLALKSGVGVFLNCLLLYCIYRHTQCELGAYKQLQVRIFNNFFSFFELLKISKQIFFLNKNLQINDHYSDHFHRNWCSLFFRSDCFSRSKISLTIIAKIMTKFQRIITHKTIFCLITIGGGNNQVISKTRQTENWNCPVLPLFLLGILHDDLRADRLQFPVSDVGTGMVGNGSITLKMFKFKPGTSAILLPAVVHPTALDPCRCRIYCLVRSFLFPRTQEDQRRDQRFKCKNISLGSAYFIIALAVSTI